jgi:uncharacterized protein (TIGR02271 family)
VRAEEELRVAKEIGDAGTVRVRKHVESHPHELVVELQREVAEVTAEPVRRPARAHDFREDSIELPMHAQRAVVRKQVVAKERVAVEKEVVAERMTVADEVRKERIVAEGDVEES